MNWRRDKNGKIVKKDDHHPDALLAGTKHLEDAQGGIMRIGPNILAKTGSGFMEFWNKLSRRA